MSPRSRRLALTLLFTAVISGGLLAAVAFADVTPSPEPVPATQVSSSNGEYSLALVITAILAGVAGIITAVGQFRRGNTTDEVEVQRLELEKKRLELELLRESRRRGDRGEGSDRRATDPP